MTGRCMSARHVYLAFGRDCQAHSFIIYTRTVAATFQISRNAWSFFNSSTLAYFCTMVKVGLLLALTEFTVTLLLVKFQVGTIAIVLGSVLLSYFYLRCNFVSSLQQTLNISRRWQCLPGLC